MKNGHHVNLFRDGRQERYSSACHTVDTRNNKMIADDIIYSAITG